MLLNLRTHEIRHFLRTGEVCVVRVFTPPPPFDTDDDISVQVAVGSIKSPIIPGTVVSCREKWWHGPQPDRAEYDADMDDNARDAARLYGAVLRSASTMPAWAIRPDLRDVRVVRAEVKRVQEVTEEEAGVVVATVNVPHPEMGFHYGDALEDWRAIFAHRWNAHAKPGRKWLDNPFCSVVTLRKERIYCTRCGAIVIGDESHTWEQVEAAWAALNTAAANPEEGK